MGYAGAILNNRKGKILFQLRDGKGRNPNKWSIFGGGINKNELSIDALIREIKEELKIQISKSDIIKHYKIPIINYHIFEVYLKSNPKKSDLKEGKDMKFMTREEFLKTKNALLRVKIFLKIFNIN